MREDLCLHRTHNRAEKTALERGDLHLGKNCTANSQEDQSHLFETDTGKGNNLETEAGGRQVKWHLLSIYDVL